MSDVYLSIFIVFFLFLYELSGLNRSSLIGYCNAYIICFSVNKFSGRKSGPIAKCLSLKNLEDTVNGTIFEAFLEMLNIF